MESFPGSYIGFCGNITYKKADTLRDSLLLVPETQLLLETDAPYLTPQAVRGDKNKPSYIVHTYDYVANLLGQSRDALAEQVTQNFQELYKT
jgi:TatD DNase family protein